VNKAVVIDKVTEATGLKKKDVTAVVEGVFRTIMAGLKKHQKVQIVGFGTFEPRRRKARTGRDPRTQEPIPVPATWSMVFRPGKHLRSSLSGRARKKRSR